MKANLPKVTLRDFFRLDQWRERFFWLKKFFTLFVKLQFVWVISFLTGFYAFVLKKQGKDVLALVAFSISLFGSSVFSYLLIVLISSLKDGFALPADTQRLPSSECFSLPPSSDLQLILGELNQKKLKKLATLFVQDRDVLLVKNLSHQLKLSQNSKQRLAFYTAVFKVFFNRSKRLEASSDLERLEVLSVFQKLLSVRDLNLGLLVSRAELNLINFISKNCANRESAPKVLLAFVSICETTILTYLNILQHIRDKQETAYFANMTNAIRAEMSAHVRIDLPPPPPFTGVNIDTSMVIDQLKVLLNIAERDIPEVNTRALKLVLRLRRIFDTCKILDLKAKTTFQNLLKSIGDVQDGKFFLVPSSVLSSMRY